MNGLNEFTFTKEKDILKMNTLINNKKYVIDIYLNGKYKEYEINEMVYTSKVLVAGYMESENILRIRFRWIETCFTKEISFKFIDEYCWIDEFMINGDDPDLSKNVKAVLVEK